MPSDRVWFYGTVGKPKGPVNEGTLLAKFESGELGPDTLVWTSGMPYWVPAREQEVFAKHWHAKSLLSHQVPRSGDAVWYFSHQGKICGPLTQDSLCDMVKSGMLGPDTAIMREGQNSWQPLWQVSELQSMIAWGGQNCYTRSASFPSGFVGWHCEPTQCLCQRWISSNNSAQR